MSQDTQDYLGLPLIARNRDSQDTWGYIALNLDNQDIGADWGYLVSLGATSDYASNSLLSRSYLGLLEATWSYLGSRKILIRIGGWGYQILRQ